MALKIVLCEDSEHYIRELGSRIESEPGLAGYEVDVVRTEVEFHRKVPGWIVEPPVAFILDVMLRYMNVGDDESAVPQHIRDMARKDKFFRAGIRNATTLLSIPELREIPIILHSILDEPQLRSDAAYPVPDSANVVVSKKEANGRGIIEALCACSAIAR